MNQSRSIDEFAHWPLDEWPAIFPAGRIERIYLHWSGGDRTSVFDAYHFCVAETAAGITVVETHDLRANMRDVSADPTLPYAQHTAGRNSFAAGLSIMGMEAARPDDFGRYPITADGIAALCSVIARLAVFYGIPLDAEHVMTHAEAAILDGYYGLHEIDERWDLARLSARPERLTEQDAREAGAQLRRNASNGNTR